jgi:hypothetical protein
MLAPVGLLVLLGVAALSYLLVAPGPRPANTSAAHASQSATQARTTRNSDPKVPAVAHDAIGARVTIHPDRPRIPGPGALGLADGLLAEGDEASSGGWVGWDRSASPVEVTLELARPTKVTKIGAHFLRAAHVALPTRVEFAISENGRDVRTVATVAEADAQRQRGWYTAAVTAVTARAVRVRATLGDGSAYLDEVAVNPPPEAPPLRHAAQGRPVTLAFPASGYTAPGIEGLTDGFVARSAEFLNLYWLGFEGKNLDATIDMGRVLDLREVGGHFLQQVKLGIFIPPAMDVLVSGDGKEFRKVATVKHAPDDRPLYLKTLSAKLDGVSGRFVRVVAYNNGSMWLFADEVFVNPESGEE